MLTTTATQSEEIKGYNLSLGRKIFSNPSNDRAKAYVVSNIPDETLGIDAGDLVSIDFTINSIHKDGYYVITLSDGWIGYRFFHFRLHSIPLHMIVGDESYPVTNEMLKDIKVIGLVKNIFKSGNLSNRG